MLAYVHIECSSIMAVRPCNADTTNVAGFLADLAFTYPLTSVNKARRKRNELSLNEGSTISQPLMISKIKAADKNMRPGATLIPNIGVSRTNTVEEHSKISQNFRMAAAAASALLDWISKPVDSFQASLNRFGDSDLARSKSIEYRMELESFSRASFEVEERGKIFRYMSEALQSSNWRAVYNSLTLLESLMTKGSKSLLSECHSGFHFDVLQRLSLLQSYSHDDARVCQLVRDLAKSVREVVKERFADFEEGSMQSVTESSVSVPIPSKVLQELKKAKRPQLHTGLVYIGHREETDSEEEACPKQIPPQPTTNESILIDLL